MNIKHFYGDQLWAAGNRDQLPDLGPPQLDVNISEDNIDSEACDDIETNYEDEPEKTNDVELLEKEVDNLELSDEAGVEQKEDVEDSRTPQERMDDCLDHALFQCLRTTYSQKKSDLPILTSNFYRLHMVPASPGQQLDIKKSSHKKLSKFLENKEKTGVLKLKELSKGVESIVSIDYDHELVRGHRVIKQEKKEEDGEEVGSSVCDSKYEPPVIVELYAVTAHVLKLFKTQDIAKGTGLTVQEVKKVLTNYVKTNNLRSEVGGFVKLDDLLREVVSCKSETMSWEDLQQATLNR